jgi:hypothetical protein
VIADAKFTSSIESEALSVALRQRTVHTCVTVVYIEQEIPLELILTATRRNDFCTLYGKLYKGLRSFLKRFLPFVGSLLVDSFTATV